MLKKSGSLAVVVILLLGALVASTGMVSWILAQPSSLSQPTTVLIQPGLTVRNIGRLLHKAGVLDGVRRFEWTVRLTGLSNALQAGEYTFEPHISVRGVINKLATGDTTRHLLTIPEGHTIAQIRELITATPQLRGDMPDTIAEGSLFPDSYEVRNGMTREKLVQTMHQRLVQKLNEAWELRATNTPLQTPEDLLILASIIQKEAGSTAEMPIIAGVFSNRLRQNMKLQSDPTVIYGATDYAGDITTMHLREDHPHNTYIHHGLPPTPIASVSRAALRAAAQPARHDYLFFVSDGQGGHIFAQTYAEHTRNVDAFVRRYRETYGN